MKKKRIKDSSNSGRSRPCPDCKDRQCEGKKFSKVLNKQNWSNWYSYLLCKKKCWQWYLSHRLCGWTQFKSVWGRLLYKLHISQQKKLSTKVIIKFLFLWYGKLHNAFVLKQFLNRSHIYDQKHTITFEKESWKYQISDVKLQNCKT